MSDPLVTVEVGACRCPGAPHPDGDVVYLDPELGPAAGIAAASVAMTDDSMTFAQRFGLMIETAIQLSVRDWTIQHDTGNGTGPKVEKVPINPETVRQQLTWDKGGAEVSVEAMKRYGPALGLPFGTRKPKSPKASSSTPIGRTESSSTSPRPSTRKRRPKPSA
jgi:hypothetical protein